MWPPSTPSLAAPPTTNSSVFIDPISFSKDGRKIHVGDCALFKPPHDPPPFVGIIRRLTVGKEDNLTLSVNWLYRPADVKLGKGASLEAAPNEVFYSFHKDEIPAASLLHPCKVAFLRKGVELPSGISSFVCRRVYDIENKCLYWLTDRDYINSYLTQERQDEVDQLLDKTRVEMYGAVQTGGRSPKPLNSPSGTTQLKPSSDNIHNSPSIPSQVKSKKREQSVHSSDSVKRERISKTDDEGSGKFRPEHMLRTEIAKITDKGGLADFEAVEKLIQLMQPESAEKKVDLSCRVMLVDVISVTERFDCLGRFVQLKGLLILDEWLQEVHKGKIGDGSPKEIDKSVEEFLFALLRALDRLPVNLHALQTCNVGKSVNHLRSHKNSEIQKKARILVDTWKKRVEAEMNVIETRSGARRGGSWPNKAMVSEVPHMNSRRTSGSSEAGTKISASQSSALKAQQGKHISGEVVAKSPESPNSVKLAAPAAAGDGSSDMPLVTIKEEKQISSCPSPNYSHSCSVDHGKASCREDSRSPTAGSLSVNKIGSGVSRGRKSSNGLNGSATVGVPKEGSVGKYSSVNRSFGSEKGSPTRATSERVADGSFGDNVSNQRLIVRLPNSSRSPAQTAGGGSPDDAPTTLGKASLVNLDKQDHHDHKAMGKVDAPGGNNVLAMNPDSFQRKDASVSPDEVKAVTVGLPVDEQDRDGELVNRLIEVSKGTGSALGVAPKPGKSYDASYSSINALVESCAKISEASVSARAGDDVGMNLLASVAAGEMSRSIASPVGSPESRSPLPEVSCSRSDAKLNKSNEDGHQSEDKSKVSNGHVTMEQVSSVESLSGKGGSLQQVLPVVDRTSVDSRITSFGCEKTVESKAKLDTPTADFSQNGNSVPVALEAKPTGLTEDASTLSFVDATNGCKEGYEGAIQSHDRRKFSSNSSRSSKLGSRSPATEEDRNAGCADEKAMKNNLAASDVATTSSKVETQFNDEKVSWSPSEKHVDDKNLVDKQSSSTNLVSQKQSPVRPKPEDSEIPTASRSNVTLESTAEEVDDKKTGCHTERREKQSMESSPSVLQHGCAHTQQKVDKNEAIGFGPGGSATSDKGPAVVQESRPCLKHIEAAEGDKCEEPSSRVNYSSVTTPVSEMGVKLDFDLNEVLPSDDGILGEVERSSIPGCSPTVHTPSPLPSANVNWPASITVAAAAKGPFFPSENLLRGKVELGWKGSAATSAFRPAEPRKVSDAPVLDNPSTNKQARPLLDFDLNVGVEDVSQNNGPSTYLEPGNRAFSCGGLDLDLNACQESPEIGQLSVSSSRPGIPQFPPGSLLSSRFSNSETNASRGFDLNNGPGLEEIGGESLPLSKNGMQFLPAVPSVRLNNMDMGNFSSWFPPSSTYPAIAIPPFLPGRGEQSYPIVPAAASQRMLSPVTASTSFNPEIFRGPVLSSSPAVPFPSTTPFQFPGFPFETNFPLHSNTFSALSTPYADSSGAPLCFPSQLVGHSGGLSAPYRPYVMSLPNVGPGPESSRKWGSQGGLDLNAGPGVGADNDKLPSALRQLPLAGSQALLDEQLKMFQQIAVGGALKRKEPDSGRDGGDRVSYKHPSWQ